MLVNECLRIKKLKVLRDLGVEVVLVAELAPKFEHAIEVFVFLQVAVAVFHLALGAPGKLVPAFVGLSLLFVYLGP